MSPELRLNIWISFECFMVAVGRMCGTGARTQIPSRTKPTYVPPWTIGAEIQKNCRLISFAGFGVRMIVLFYKFPKVNLELRS